jgi:hypothetical protein
VPVHLGGSSTRTTRRPAPVSRLIALFAGFALNKEKIFLHGNLLVVLEKVLEKVVNILPVP